MLLKEEEEPYKREEKKSRENFNEIKVEPDLSKLTRQEKIIAEMIKQGLSNREIGEELYISESTVKKHVSNIFAKLGISSRKEL